MRILYVEDNPANLFLIKRVAKMGDHEVINLIDGEEALRKIDMIKPDLILMDIQLAGQLTGLDVVRKLRTDGYKMPIVAVTAYAMVGDRERCLEAGCNEYLSKPLPIGRVVELLQLYQAGEPAPAPVNEDDSSVFIPILTRPNAPTATPSSPAAPAETPTSPTASETPAAPAVETLAASTTSAVPVVETPAAPAVETPAVSEPSVSTTSAVPAVDEAEKKETAEATSPSLPKDSLAAPEPQLPGLSLAVESENAHSAGDLSSAVSESGAEADPAVESTSQEDTSHPQDTVQAQ